MNNLPNPPFYLNPPLNNSGQKSSLKHFMFILGYVRITHFFLSGYSFADTDDLQDSRGWEGPIV